MCCCHNFQEKKVKIAGKNYNEKFFVVDILFHLPACFGLNFVGEFIDFTLVCLQENPTELEKYYSFEFPRINIYFPPDLHRFLHLLDFLKVKDI